MAAPTDPAQVGEILRTLDAFAGGPVVSAALRLLPLLFVRDGVGVRVSRRAPDWKTEESMQACRGSQ